MKLIQKLLPVVCAFALLRTAPCARGNLTFTNLISFAKTNGSNPSAGLVQAADGNFYGTTEFGGAKDYGTVFKMTPAGSLTTLVSFGNTNGALPLAGLVQGTNGILYGTTSTGGAYTNQSGDGYGTVFQVTTGGVLTTLFSFNNTNGAGPLAGMAQGADGNLYGTTQLGGTYNLGTVFKMTLGGALTTVVSFEHTNGAFPQAGLVQGTNGNLYGTAGSGGTNGYGTVFEVAPNGTHVFVPLASASFDNTNGASPYGGLALGGDGNFYGTTYGGGTSGAGAVFMVTPTGTLSNLFSFGNTNGSNPYGGLAQGVDGNFYGTAELGGANDYGTIFKITPAGTLTTLLAFDDFTVGAFPQAGLVRAADGSFYGTTHDGGAYGYGTIFRFTTLPVLSVTRTGGTLMFAWGADLGQMYQMQYKTNLSQANWINLGNAFPATNTTATASDTIGPNPRRYYRVMLSP